MSYRVRFTMPDGRTGLWMRDYATREDAQQAIDDRMADTGFLYYVEEVATPEARIRELEAEVAHLRDAYDAARQDRDAAMRRLATAEDLGDAMHRTMTTAQTYLSGEWGGVNVALANWVEYRDGITVERQGPAKEPATHPSFPNP